MCGIAALISLEPRYLEDSISQMARLIRHRGPDGEGYALASREGAIELLSGSDTPIETLSSLFPNRPTRKVNSSADDTRSIVAMAHRRLSIIDLSPSGHQPMVDSGKQALIVFNGEIYNFIEIREELEAQGVRFFSSSDTEVLLQAYLKWGVGCLDRLNGMFAFVLYMPFERRVFAARDRFGVKPLYYWKPDENSIAFSSEIKAFTALSNWKPKLNAQRAFDFIISGLTDHTDETLFDDVFQLRGGQYIESDVEALAGGLVTPRTWYDLEHKISERSERALSFSEASEKFGSLFESAVHLRLRSDVRVGTALSGGLDSSSIVCEVNRLLRANAFESSNASIRQDTFSSSSSIDRFDERRYIKKVIERTGVNAHFVETDLDRFLSLHDQVVWHHDEPVGSSSVMAEWDVFKLVSGTDVKVTLDGHGADESLAGYHTFFGARLASLLREGRFSDFLRECEAVHREHGYGAGFIGMQMLDWLLPAQVSRLARRVAGLSYYDPKIVSLEWRRNGRVKSIKDPAKVFGARTATVLGHSLAQLLRTSLPHQLHWCDRDSMAHGIESRAPFLDYRLIEFLLSCRDEYKVSSGMTKRVLREGVKRIVPQEIVERRDKMGFVTPEEFWITDRHPALFIEKVDEAIALSGNFLGDHARVRAKRIIRKQERFSFLVWRMISFGSWMKRFGVSLC